MQTYIPPCSRCNVRKKRRAGTPRPPASYCGGGDSGELVLRDVLLVLAVDHLGTRDTWVDAEERVVRDADDGLLGCHLRELVVRRDVVHGDIIVDLPLFDNLSTLDVQVEQGVGLRGGHQDHLRVLVVQHHLQGMSSSARAYGRRRIRRR